MPSFVKVVSDVEYRKLPPPSSSSIGKVPPQPSTNRDQDTSGREDGATSTLTLNADGLARDERSGLGGGGGEGDGDGDGGGLDLMPATSSSSNGNKRKRRETTTTTTNASASKRDGKERMMYWHNMCDDESGHREWEGADAASDVAVAADDDAPAREVVVAASSTAVDGWEEDALDNSIKVRILDYKDDDNGLDRAVDIVVPAVASKSNAGVVGINDGARDEESGILSSNVVSDHDKRDQVDKFTAGSDIGGVKRKSDETKSNSDDRKVPQDEGMEAMERDGEVEEVENATTKAASGAGDELNEEGGGAEAMDANDDDDSDASINWTIVLEDEDVIKVEPKFACVDCNTIYRKEKSWMKHNIERHPGILLDRNRAIAHASALDAASSANYDDSDDSIHRRVIGPAGEEGDVEDIDGDRHGAIVSRGNRTMPAIASAVDQVGIFKATQKRRDLASSISPKITEVEPKFACVKCNQVFMQWKKCIKHFNNRHPGSTLNRNRSIAHAKALAEVEFACVECDKVFKKWGWCKQHRDKCHPGLKMDKTRSIAHAGALMKASINKMKRAQRQRAQRRHESNGNSKHRDVISKDGVADEQHVEHPVEHGDEGGKVGPSNSASASHLSVHAEPTIEIEIERVKVLPDGYTDLLRRLLADFVYNHLQLVKNKESRINDHRFMKLLEVNIPIISSIVPTSMDEMIKLGLMISMPYYQKQTSWIYKVTSSLLEAINSFIQKRELGRYCATKAQWSPNVWLRYQYELLLRREGNNAPTSAAAVTAVRHTVPIVPSKRADCNIGVDAGTTHNPFSAQCANSFATGDRSHGDRGRQIPALERFSEYRIDNASSVANLESIRRRLLNLVDRVDVRLKEKRFSEALSGSFGKETIEGLSTKELMDMLSQEIDKSDRTGSCNFAFSNANRGGNIRKASEDAHTNDDASKHQRIPITCSLCFNQITSPTFIATCEICDDEGICNKCHVNCSCCHRLTCADCLMTCDGCGSDYNCSDCVAVRSGNCVVCHPKAKNKLNWLPRHASNDQGSTTKARHSKDTTSSLSSGNQMIRLPQFHPPHGQSFPRTNAHPAKATTSGTSHQSFLQTNVNPAMAVTNEQPHSSNDPSQLYSIHRFVITEAGTIGINLTKLSRKCLVSTVHPHSIAFCHGIEEGDEILYPGHESGMNRPDVYNLFITASKHRPLLFEVKRSYKRRDNKQVPLPGCYSLHRFVIGKPGKIDVFLDSRTSIVRLDSVAPDGLGALYGLRNDDILCEPLTNGKLARNSKDLTQAVKSGQRPFIIEVWRVLPTSSSDLINSTRMPEPGSGIDENPFKFSFPTDELTIGEKKNSGDPSMITCEQIENMNVAKEIRFADATKVPVAKEIISIDDNSISN